MMPNRPQDRKRKKLNIGGTAVAQALGHQAANMAQKAMLDNLVAKLVAVMRILTVANKTPIEGRPTRAQIVGLQEAIGESLRIFQLDRLQIAELTSQPASGYPDQEIQDVLDEAVEKMVALLMDPDRLTNQQASDA
jgi:hypothetical protein